MAVCAISQPNGIAWRVQGIPAPKGSVTVAAESQGDTRVYIYTPYPVFSTALAEAQGIITLRFNKRKNVPYKAVLTHGPTGKTEYYTVYGNGHEENIPIKLGAGSYTVCLAEQMDGDTYIILKSIEYILTKENELGPWLAANAYVNYAEDAGYIVDSRNLFDGGKSDEKIICNVQKWVHNSISFDETYAALKTPGYLPVLEDVYEASTGICYDYASLMAAVCRANGFPAKLSIGMVEMEDGEHLHAWVSVFYEGEWHLHDPTLRASGNAGPDKYLVLHEY